MTNEGKLPRGWMAALLLAALLPAVLAGAAERPQSPEEVAQALLAELEAGEWEKALARLDDSLRARLSPAQLASLWQATKTQTGALVAVGTPQREDVGGMAVVLLPCQFERTAVNLRVVFSAEGRIASFTFVPAHVWQPAGYVRREAFHEHDVTLGAAPYALPGKLTVPTGEGPFPAVVLVHGSGPHDEDETIGPNKPFRDLAWGLSSHGLAVLRYVKRTRAHPQALARLENLTVNEETVEDARAAVALLAARAEVDPARIFVLGHSLGGYVAARIARDCPYLAGVILLAANTRPIEELVLEQVRYLAELDGQINDADEEQLRQARETFQAVRDPGLAPGMTVPFLGSRLPASYFLDLRGYDPAGELAALGIPVLVLQGGRDYQVTPADLEGWKAAFAGREDATFRFFPNLNHLFLPGEGTPSPADYLRPGNVAGEVIREIAAWIAAQPAPRGISDGAGAAGKKSKAGPGAGRGSPRCPHRTAEDGRLTYARTRSSAAMTAWVNSAVVARPPTSGVVCLPSR